MDSNKVFQTIVDILDKLIPAYSRRILLTDDLVTDLKIDSDDLSFYFIPEIEKRLNVQVPIEEWNAVSTIEEIRDLILRYDPHEIKK